MNELLNFSNLELSPLNISEYIVGIIITILYCLIIRYVYITYSESVSNKKILANLFPLFGVSIFLIVITIKSSIVLSLGLVGALSIIRFRTAIKEPEQIIYFLILTAISISTAAGSYISPLIFILFIIVYNFYIYQKRSEKVYSVNDQLILSAQKIENNHLNEIIDLLNKYKVNVLVQSINKNDDKCVIVLKLSDFDINILKHIESYLKNENISKTEIQFFSSSE